MLLSRTECFEVLNEATWVIGNIAEKGNHDQIRTLVSLNVIRPLCQFLACSTTNLISNALRSLEHILTKSETDERNMMVNSIASLIEECNGVENLKKLVIENLTIDISQQAEKILVKYFKNHI